MALETVEHCPVCDHQSFVPFLTCDDYVSSNESFTLQQCTKCSFLLTNPRPNATSLPAYYDSPKYISHTGKSTGILDKIYLFVRQFTVRTKVNFVRRLKPSGSILDYGCGTGELLHAFKTSGWSIAGLEPSSIARQKASHLNGIKIATEIAELEHDQFDIIMLWHVLEHIPDLHKIIAHLKMLLAQDGKLVVALPNYQSPDSQHYGQYWAGYDVPRHLWHFSKTSIAQLMAREGFHLQSVHPMKLDAFYVSLLSEKYKHPKRAAIRQYLSGTINGLRSNQKARDTNNHSSLIYILRK